MDRTFNLPQPLHKQQEPLACSVHKEALITIFAPGRKIDKWAVSMLKEISTCVACRLVLAAMTHDVTYLRDLGMSQVNTPTLKRSPSLAASSTALPITGLQKREGKYLSGILRSGGALKAVPPSNQAPMRVIGMFNINCSERSKRIGDPTCIVALWQLDQGIHHIDVGFGVDEMAFFLLEGRTEWCIEGGQATEASASDDSAVLLWASADPTNLVGGIPPFEVAVESEAAYGITILYDAWGVKYREDNYSRQIEVLGRNWASGEIVTYWKAIERHVHQMKNNTIFCESIPVGRNALKEVKRLIPRSIETYAHRGAKKNGQLVDRYLVNWPSEESAEFHSREMLLDEGEGKKRSQPVLDFCIVEFPARGATIPRNKLDVARHEGCYEVLVPLTGKIDCFAVEPKMRERELDGGRSLDYFMRRNRHIDYDTIFGSDVIESNLPDVLMLNSSHFHGFTAAEPKSSHALHIRCYDYAARGEHRRVSADAEHSPSTYTRRGISR